MWKKCVSDKSYVVWEAYIVIINIWLYDKSLFCLKSQFLT